eukprot:GILJ01011550.1.p1 GENE.GILJ01011550.1~~GILJ01011550.1.p1  ORF type:complete len:487 (+),score=35.47 GILJ01011550.1:40-1461(+)
MSSVSLCCLHEPLLALVFSFLNCRELETAELLNKHCRSISKFVQSKPCWQAAIFDDLSDLKDTFDCLCQRLTHRPTFALIMLSVDMITTNSSEAMELINKCVPADVVCVVGCGFGIIGPHKHHGLLEDVEHTCGVMTVMYLPDVRLDTMTHKPFDIDALNPDRIVLSSLAQWTNGHGSNTTSESLALFDEDWSIFLVFVRQHAHHSGRMFLHALSHRYPGASMAGGLTGGPLLAVRQRGTWIQSDLVAVAFAGNVDVKFFSSRGCQSLSPAYQVESGGGDTVDSVTDQTGMSHPVTHIIPADVASLESPTGLYVGVATSAEAEQGYSLRQAVGTRRRRGSLVVRPALTAEERYIKFFALTSAAASDQLQARLQSSRGLLQQEHKEVLGAMLFTCSGRGMNLYPRPNVESQLFESSFPSVPLSGIFCAGEIGPADRAGEHLQPSEVLLAQTRHPMTTMQPFSTIFCLFLAPARN